MQTGEFAPTTERDALALFLDRQRNAFIEKIEGISDADARLAPTVSSLSLLGLLKHLGLWERRWFQITVAGRLYPGEWPEVKADWQDDDFRVGPNDTVANWLAYYREQAEISRQIVAERELDSACELPKLAGRNLRWVMFHMIEEVARHAGHADLIRETLDARSN